MGRAAMSPPMSPVSPAVCPVSPVSPVSPAVSPETSPVQGGRG